MTGADLSASEMLRLGERNYALRKLLATREGYTRADDDIPHRLKEPLSGGVSDGWSIDDKELQQRINEYYQLRGFDDKGPTRELLQTLGLNGLIDYLPGGEV